MICGTFLSFWAIILLVVGIGEEVHLQGRIDRAMALSNGASSEEVLAVIGEPDHKWKARDGWLFFAAHPDQWIYGTTINLESIVVPGLPFPNPIPLKLRLFSSDLDDLVVEWNTEGKLAKIVKPDLHVSDEARDLFEPLFALGQFVSIAYRVSDWTVNAD